MSRKGKGENAAPPVEQSAGAPIEAAEAVHAAAAEPTVEAEPERAEALEPVAETAEAEADAGADETQPAISDDDAPPPDLGRGALFGEGRLQFEPATMYFAVEPISNRVRTEPGELLRGHFTDADIDQLLRLGAIRVATIAELEEGAPE